MTKSIGSINNRSINGAYGTNKILTAVLIILIALQAYVFFKGGYASELGNKLTISYQTDYNGKEVTLTQLHKNDIVYKDKPRYIIPFEKRTKGEPTKENIKYELKFMKIEDSKIGILVKPKDLKYFSSEEVKIYQKDGLMTLAD